MSTRFRWSVFAAGWIAAVVVTTLIVARAISFVGTQLATDVALPRASTPASSGASPQPLPQSSPTGTTRPGGSKAPTPQVVPQPTSGSGNVAEPTVDGTTPPPQTPDGGPTTQAPVPNPEPRTLPPPRPLPSPTTAPPVNEPDPGTGAGTPPVAQPPVNQPVPIVISDRRVVETKGGTASFTCTSTNRLSLVTASPASGFKQADSRVRDETRMDVVFEGATDQKIDARCRDGQVDVSVE